MAYNYGIIITCFLVTTSAYLKPSRTIPDKWFRRENQNEKAEARAAASDDDDDDQEIEPSERRQDQEDVYHTSEHQPGRVQIKVYRGPYDENEQFAPHGFWVKQPADGHR